MSEKRYWDSSWLLRSTLMRSPRLLRMAAMSPSKNFVTWELLYSLTPPISMRLEASRAACALSILADVQEPSAIIQMLLFAPSTEAITQCGSPSSMP